MFLEVVEARSFTAAAERLGRTKSALSQAVSRLEQDLGFRLLFRNTRSLSLTDDGAKVFSQSQNLRHAYDEAVSMMNRLRQDPEGSLSITAPHALCSTLISPTIGQFVAKHPRMQVRLIAEDALTDLIQSQVDLAIRVGQPRLQTAKASKLGMLRESLFASREYVATQGGKPDQLQELASWCHLANDWQGNPISYRAMTGESLRVKPQIRCNAFPDILQMVQLGVGVARLPDLTIHALESAHHLLKLFPLEPTPIYYMHLFPERTPRRVRDFIKVLKQVVARL